MTAEHRRAYYAPTAEPILPATSDIRTAAAAAGDLYCRHEFRSAAAADAAANAADELVAEDAAANAAADAAAVAARATSRPSSSPFAPGPNSRFARTPRDLPWVSLTAYEQSAATDLGFGAGRTRGAAVAGGGRGAG